MDVEQSSLCHCYLGNKATRVNRVLLNPCARRTPLEAPAYEMLASLKEVALTSCSGFPLTSRALV